MLLFGIIAFFLIIIFSGTKIQSVDEYYLTHIDDIETDSKTVTLAIRCDTIRNNWDKLDVALKSETYVPKDGFILKKTTYVLRANDTVFSILDRATRYNKIQMEYQGEDRNAYNSVYIQGINYLYEYSCGPLSGWMYKVNGEYPNYGCSRYQLQDKDEIEFVYTCDLGRDVGATMGGIKR